jgi:hypothetical protein
MSTKSEISKAGTPITCTTQRDRRGIWHIILPGLFPLALLAVIGVAVMALVALIRLLMDPASFLLQQQLFLIVMITGLAVAIIAYTITITRALRRIETWRRNGHTTKATAGLVVVTLVAIVMVLPVILTLFFH